MTELDPFTHFDRVREASGLSDDQLQEYVGRFEGLNPTHQGHIMVEAIHRVIEEAGALGEEVVFDPVKQSVHEIAVMQELDEQASRVEAA